MEEGGSFILCEGDFLQTSFSAFQNMKETGEFTDVIIRCKTRLFSAHRVVLAARIPYFRKLLATRESEISLNEIDPDVLESLINFAYEGKLKVAAENVQPMLVAAGYLRLEQVQKACWEFIAKRLNSDGASVRFIPPDLAIREKFDEFSDSEEFLVLPYSFLKELVSRDDLRVASEAKVFEAVIKWVKMAPTGRQHLLPHLLTEIRMVNLTPDYLVEQVATEELIKTSDQCRHIVEEAKNYHLLPGKRSLSLSFKTNPRIYIDAHQNVSHENTRSTEYEIVPRDNTMSMASNQSTSHGSIIRDRLYIIYSLPSGQTSVRYHNKERKKWVKFPAIIDSEDIEIVGAVFLNGMMYVFYPNSVKAFNVETRVMSGLEPAKELKQSGIVSHMNTIYIFGGIFHPKKLRKFDPSQQEKWLPEEEMRTGRGDMGVTSYLGKCICITGGLITSCCSSLVEEYNPITKAWTELPSMLFARMYHGCAELNGKIYVCGGRDDNALLLNTAEVYNGVTNQWTSISPISEPRRSLSLVVWDGELFTVGGITEEVMCSLELEVYCPDTDVWKEGTTTPFDVIDSFFLKAVVVNSSID